MTQPQTLRLFVAIELPAPVLDQLSAIQHQLQRDPALASLRWTRPDGIHLTLKFLGETPAARQKDIEQAIARATTGVQTFDLHFGRLGKFGSRSAPRVLWIDLAGDITGLNQLHSNVERELAQLRYPPENRAYSPHLTLARVPPERAREVAAPLEAAIASLTPPAGVIPAREVALMRSELGPSGAVYTQLFAAPLS